MKRTGVLVLALCLLTQAGGCAKPDGAVGSGTSYCIYYSALGDESAESAVACEARLLPEQEDQVPALMQALLTPPETQTLASPFPDGVRLLSWAVEDGCLHLDLSEHYGGLSGMELSLADACIVLTCCQLPQVSAVALTVEGRPRPFREAVLSPEDLLLDNGKQPLGRVEALLWFPGGEGLASEERDLQLAIGDDPATAVLQTLLSGPEGADLQRVAPEGTRLLSLERTGEGWQVDLSAPFAELAGGERSAGEEAIARTLWELESALPVTILVEGEVLSHWDVPEE